MPKTDYKGWTKAVLIPVSELVLTDWNCNEMEPGRLAQLQSDIESDESGDIRFDEPIQVVPIKGQANKWLVIGGEHRTKVMISLDQESVPCVIRWDLADKSRKELMLWSVRRNNLRGKISSQKYAELEDELINDHGMAAEAARQTMLIGEDLAKALNASLSARHPSETVDDDDDYVSDRNKTDNLVAEGVKAERSKADLLNALKIVEQDVLLDSADTVKNGYLFFVQGNKGQTHLVVDESVDLHGFVAKMVSNCKGNSSKVDDFLSAAIETELKKRGE